MEAKLTIVGGRANKKRIVLQLPAVIGRSREAGLTIAHAMVSRQHCRIFEQNGTLRVRDLGSLNGTFVGQKQIEETALVPGDEITVGPLTFRVEYSSAETPTPAAPNPVKEPPILAKHVADTDWAPPATVPAPPPVVSVVSRDAPSFAPSSFLPEEEGLADEPVIDLASLIGEAEGVPPPEEIAQPEVEDCVEELPDSQGCDVPVHESDAPKGLFSDLPPIVSDVVPEVIAETEPEPASSSVSAVFEDAPAIEEAAVQAQPSAEEPEVEEPEVVIELEEIAEIPDDQIVEVPAEVASSADPEFEAFLATPPPLPPSQEEDGGSDLAAFFRDLQK